MGAVHGVGPDPCSGQVEMSIAVATRHIGLGDESSITVNVLDRERSSSRLHRVRLCQAGRADPTNNRRIIGSNDRDRDHLGCAVSRLHGKAVGISCPCPELIVRRVHGVGPHTSCIDRELAVARTACHVRLRGERCRTVHIAHEKRSRGRLCCVTLGQSRSACARDHRSVISPSNIKAHRS